MSKDKIYTVIVEPIESRAFAVVASSEKKATIKALEAWTLINSQSICCKVLEPGKEDKQFYGYIKD